MAELSTWLLILLLTSPGLILANVTATPMTTMSSDNTILTLFESSTVDTTNIANSTIDISMALSSRSEPENATTPDISVAISIDGSPTVASPTQQILTTDATASSAQSAEESPTAASLIPSSLTITSSSITRSNNNQEAHSQIYNLTTSSTYSPPGIHSDNSSSELSNDSEVTQEHTSQETSLSATTGYLLSQSSNTEPSITYQSSPAGTVNSVVPHADEAHTTMLSSAKASVATTPLESTSHVSAGVPLHLSTSDIKTSASLSETTVLNRDVVDAQRYQSLLHKYQVTKTTLIAVSVGSGLLILFLLVTIAVLCCTRRTCKQAKAQCSQAASSFPDGGQLHSWQPSLPRPSIRPSVYREVSVEMRDNLQRRQRSLIEQSRTADAANHDKIQAVDGQVNEGFTSDANVDVPKQPTVAQAGGHKSSPVTFGPVSVVTISATTPRVSQPITSPSPTSLPSETKALTMPRMTMATTSSAQAEIQPLQNASTHLNALNGDPGRGQPQKKRRELVYF